MYKYRVLGYTTSGNGKRFYKILDLETGEIFEKYAVFFAEQGNDAFINVSVTGKHNFSLLRCDKNTAKYEMNQKRVKARMGQN